MKKPFPFFIAVIIIGGVCLSGCGKSSSDETASPTAKGPIDDAGNAPGVSKTSAAPDGQKMPSAPSGQGK